MQVVYDNQCVDVSTVRCWAKMCTKEECGKADLNDKPRSGRPVTAMDKSHQDRVDELIREKSRI
jgi:transposase